MIEVRRGLWAYLEEFAGPTFGREDPPDVVQTCLDYLHSQRGERRAEQRTPDMMIRSALAAARVQASTVAAPAALSIRLAELKATVEQQQTTIDHLLARIPGRMHELAVERLTAIVTDITRHAMELFDLPDPPTIEIQPDRDVESESCHRIGVRIPVTGAFDPEGFAEREVRLHQMLARKLSEDEFRAVQLFVEPEFRA